MRPASLPACAAPYGLTATRLQVRPNPDSVDGYTVHAAIPPDPQYAAFPSSPPEVQATAALVLLPGAPTAGPARYVVGPAQLVASSVKAARATYLDGAWLVDLTLTEARAAQVGAPRRGAVPRHRGRRGERRGGGGSDHPGDAVDLLAVRRIRAGLRRIHGASGPDARRRTLPRHRRMTPCRRAGGQAGGPDVGLRVGQANTTSSSRGPRTWPPAQRTSVPSARWKTGTRRSHSSRAIRSSILARFDPAHRWMPEPNATCRFS